LAALDMTWVLLPNFGQFYRTNCSKNLVSDHKISLEVSI
jgi:hypothetical protein